MEAPGAPKCGCPSNILFAGRVVVVQLLNGAAVVFDNQPVVYSPHGELEWVFRGGACTSRRARGLDQEAVAAGLQRVAAAVVDRHLRCVHAEPLGVRIEALRDHSP